MLKPRNALNETRAQGQIQRHFFKEYVHAQVLGGEDREVGDASAVFEGDTLQYLRSRLSEEALTTPVLLTDRLSNRSLAVHITLRDGSQCIAVNARFKIDPELLAHALLEEYAHAQQVLDGVDCEAQREQFPEYDDRPYEQEAKQIATEALGYAPKDYTTYLVREEPSGVLYDRRDSSPG